MLPFLFLMIANKNSSIQCSYIYPLFFISIFPVIYFSRAIEFFPITCMNICILCVLQESGLIMKGRKQSVLMDLIPFKPFKRVWRKIEITGFGTFFCFNFKFNLSFCFYHNVELILRKNSLKRDFFEVKLGRKLPDAKTSIQKGNIWYIFGKN